MAKNTKNIDPAKEKEPFDAKKIIYENSVMQENASPPLEKKRHTKTIVDTSGINEDEIRRMIAGNMANYERNAMAKILNPENKSIKKTSSEKSRKLNLQEYKDILLSVPKITDRRTVFISNNIRESVVSIVRKLDVEKSSVSGFIENLLRHHLETYREDVEKWIKQ